MNRINRVGRVDTHTAASWVANYLRLLHQDVLEEEIFLSDCNDFVSECLFHVMQGVDLNFIDPLIESFDQIRFSPADKANIYNFMKQHLTQQVNLTIGEIIPEEYIEIVQRAPDLYSVRQTNTGRLGDFNPQSMYGMELDKRYE